MALVKRIFKNIEDDFNQTIDGVKESFNKFTGKATATVVDSASTPYDPRAIIRVPSEYMGNLLSMAPATSQTGNPIEVKADTSPLADFKRLGGIIFPFTPTITVDNKAEYAPQSILHANYQQYFYKNSSVGPINVSGKFTVQDEYEGMILLATIHLLRSLTKMRFGRDDFAGSPPPICRFSAYGDLMYKDIPVSIATWKHELPDSVDYISVNLASGKTMVPVLSTISIDMNIMYSRREMMDFNVNSLLNGTLGRGFI